MKGTIRAFSVGLFVAGIIIVVTFLFIGDTATSEKNAEELPLDEMIEIMKSEGYRVVTESEYISLSVADNGEDGNNEEKKDDETNEDKSKNNNEKNSKSEDKEDSKDEKKVVKYTLNIKDGMPSSEIGHLLEENNVIEDGSKFNKYLEDEGYSLGVQLGKFDITSDMSFKEIAKAITR